MVLGNVLRDVTHPVDTWRSDPVKPELLEKAGHRLEGQEPETGSAVQMLGRTGRRERTATLTIDDPLLNEFRGARAFKTLEKMALDPIIAGVLQLDKLLLRAADWSIEPGGEEQLDIDFSDFVNENIARLRPGWQSTVGAAADMVLWGFQVFEVLFEQVEPAVYMWSGFMPLDPRTVSQWITDPQTGQLEGLIQLGADGRSIPIPAWKLLHFRTEPTPGRPEGRSLARNAFLVWTDKQELRRIMKVGLRRDLTGMIKIEAPSKLFSEGASPEDKAALAEAETMAREIERDIREGLVIPHEQLEDGNPSGWRISLMGSTGRRQIDIEKLWTMLNRDMAIAMVGDSILIGHENTGSLALKSSTTTTQARAAGSWLDVIEEHMEQYALPVLKALNPRFANAATPILKHGDIEELPIAELADYFSKLISAGGILPDLGLDEFLRRRVNAPESVGQEEL